MKDSLLEKSQLPHGCLTFEVPLTTELFWPCSRVKENPSLSFMFSPVVGIFCHSTTAANININQK